MAKVSAFECLDVNGDGEPEIVVFSSTGRLQIWDTLGTRLFSKVVMIRNRLRVLEQQINGAELPADVKLKLQGYITACYGSLTNFNVLFADEDDRFRGSSGPR